MGKKAKKPQIVYIIDQRKQEEKAFEFKLNLALDKEQLNKIIDLIWKSLALNGLTADDSDVRAVAMSYMDSH